MDNILDTDSLKQTHTEQPKGHIIKNKNILNLQVNNPKDFNNLHLQNQQRNIDNDQKIQLQITQEIMMMGYESVTHLLDNLLVLEGILESKDKKLLYKAFEYFHDHLVSLVKNLHKFPISSAQQQKKTNFIERHLSIINDLSFKNSKQITDKDTSFDVSKISRVNTHQAQNSSNSNIIFKQMNQIPNTQNELEQAKLIIDQLNKYYEDQSYKFKQRLLGLEQEYQSQKLKFINIIEDLQVEIVRLRYQKIRDEMIIEQLKSQLSKKSPSIYHRQISSSNYENIQ